VYFIALGLLALLDDRRQVSAHGT